MSFLILIRASSTIGPQELRSTWYFCMMGFSAGLSGFWGTNRISLRLASLVLSAYPAVDGEGLQVLGLLVGIADGCSERARGRSRKSCSQCWLLLASKTLDVSSSIPVFRAGRQPANPPGLPP